MTTRHTSDQGRSSSAPTNTQRPPLTCKCGGSASFIGMQVMKELGFQQAVHNCSRCDSSVTGPREPLADSEPPAVQR